MALAKLELLEKQGCKVIEQQSEWQQDHEILKAYSNGANEVLESIKYLIEQYEHYLELLDADMKDGSATKKYQSRKEQRNVTETMNALLLPLLPYLTSDTATIVKRALYLLGEIEVEPIFEETEGSGEE